MTSTLQALFFYVFSAVLLVASFRVITARNPVHAVIYLVLTFFQAAAIWLLLQAEFLAIVLVLVYVGAVMVLFLFVLMMLNFDVAAMRVGFWRLFPAAAAVGGLFALELGAVLLLNYHTVTQPQPMRGADGAVLAANAANTKELGKLLYSQYLLPVELAAVLLLVAIIAAITLTLRRRKDSKYQSPDWQVSVKPTDRVRVLKMQATQPAPAKAEAEAEAEAESLDTGRTSQSGDKK